MTEASVDVAPLTPGADPATFAVEVTEGDSTSRHMVTLAATDRARLSREDESEEDFIRRCFVFLLEREPKESILGVFDVSVIPTYFPEFESAISG